MRSILKMTGERRKYIAFTLIVLFVTASIAVVISLYHPEGSEPPCMTTTSNNVIATNAFSSSNGLSKYPNGQQPYLDVPKVYASLGYPKITYDNYDTSYLPSEPNFTLEYRTKDAGFHVGTVQAPAISLKKAVELAADYAKLNPSSYNLGEAVFVPGTVFNSTLIAWPQWFLYFAEIHDGYWIYGNHGPYALSLELFVNAMSGAVARMDGDSVNPTNPGQYELSVNSSRALKTVRQSNLPGVPAALTENGTVSFIEPRVVIPGLSPNSRWLDSSLSGQSRLLWIIELDYSNFGGTFAVDAGSGALAGGTAGVRVENPPGGSYYGSIAFSTAKNLAVCEQTFQMDGSIIGTSESVRVAVPDVLIAKPGSTSSIQLNFTTFKIGNPPNVTLSFANPLPGFQNLSSSQLPPGVSFQFSSPTLTLPSNGSAYATLLISVDGNAPSGTYLIEVDATYFRSYFMGKIPVLFFLSVWSGVGRWPPPPMIK